MTERVLTVTSKPNDLMFCIDGYKSWLYEMPSGNRGREFKRREIADYLDANEVQWEANDFGGRILVFDDGHIEEAPEWDGDGDPPEPDDAYTDDEWMNCVINVDYADARMAALKIMFW